MSLNENLKAQIQRQQDLMAASVAAGDSSRAAQFYTEDACLMAPGLPTFEGRPAIAAFFAGAIAQGIARARFITEEVDDYGDLALERGRYQLYAAPPGGAEQCVETGRYFLSWRKTAEGWKIHRDMFNQDAPAQS